MTANNQMVERQGTQAVEGTAQPMERRQVYIPATDIYERDDAVVLVADMPGVSESGVEVHLENDVLTLRGRVETAREEGLDELYSEYGDGEYERVFTLSNDIDRNKIQARIKHGVLRVVLPKAEQVRPRRITVQAGD